MTLNDFIKKYNIRDLSAGPNIRIGMHYATQAHYETIPSEVRKAKMDTIKLMLISIHEATRKALEDFKNIEE